MRDIAGGEREEVSLRESEERFRTAFNSCPIPAMLFKAENFLIVDVNECQVETFGWTRNELVGQLGPTVDGFADPGEPEAAIATLVRDGALRNYEVAMKTKLGEPRTVLWSASYLEIGGVRHILAMANDVTELKQATEALQASEEAYRWAYEKTPALLHSLDSERRVVAVSDTWLETLGYEREEVIGRPPADFLTEESAQFVQSTGLPRVWKEGSIREVPLQFVKKNGEILEVMLSAIAVRDDRGDVIRTIAALTDVTELKRAQEALERAREELEAKAERSVAGENRYGLTFREFTVLHLLAEGRADKEIAGELMISPLTVHKHVSNILSKMSASSRTEAGTRALREGLLE